MRGMVGMRRTRVGVMEIRGLRMGMMGMREIRVEIRRIGVGIGVEMLAIGRRNERNQGENSHLYVPIKSTYMFNQLY